MSSVTNVILTCEIAETLPLILRDENLFPILVSCSNAEGGNWVGGTKHLGAKVYIGALNYWSFERLVNFIKALKFDYPESVRVYVQGQDDNNFTEYHLSDFKPIEDCIYQDGASKLGFEVKNEVITVYWMDRNKELYSMKTILLERKLKSSRELRIIKEAFGTLSERLYDFR